MSSKRNQEGYLMIDHRFTPGVPPDIVRACGLPLGAGQGLFEAATSTCSHCQAIVVMNPERTRERAYCRKCDHYICDRCAGVMAQTRECKTFKQIIDEVQAHG
jgi:hypothetical protein